MQQQSNPPVSGCPPVRLLAVRLLSPLQPGGLASLAEELEESVCCHAVTVVLQRRLEEPHAALVAALPSRDLGWEMSRLRARGYSGLSEIASEISMREGDQLLLRFSGNITSTGRVTCFKQKDEGIDVQMMKAESDRKGIGLMIRPSTYFLLTGHC